MALISKPAYQYIWASGGDKIDPNNVKIQLGWVEEVPPLQYFNWLDNRQDQAIAHILQLGISVWDNETEYQANKSYVQGSDGNIYKAIQTQAGNDPVADVTNTYWVSPFAGFGVSYTKAESDAKYLTKTANLSDLNNIVTARANLSVYSIAQVDALIASISGPPDASETVKGILELATTAEAQAGTDDLRAMTPLKVKQAIEQFAEKDFLNKAIATVAASGTIDLTTGAPATSQIAISGTGVSINGFTVAANRFFIVKMTGASNTLVNSASLVTGRGANIPVVAGDSFLMRSTAANTVEIICGTFLADRGIGSGQTWQDLTGSRTLGTNYTNTTGRSIMVTVYATQNAASLTDIIVGGVVAARAQASTSVEGVNAAAIVPPGAIYSVTTGNTLAYWAELR